jgi:hypothetical protein
MWTAVIAGETYKRPYLIDPVTLHMITVQNKAWNDSAGMLMHIQLQLAPYKALHFPDLPCMMVVDNCGCHKVVEVVAAFETAGWILKFFPANMTGELQPMDLVVNAVCKKALRRLRIGKVLDFMRRYKLRAMLAAAAKQDLPPFNPPVPKMADGVKAMLGLMQNEFVSPEFQESLAKCFVKVGLCPHAVDENHVPLFRTYQHGSRLGKMTKPLAKAVKAMEKKAEVQAKKKASVSEVVSEDDHDEELLVEEDIDRDFYSIAGLLVRMEIRDDDDADRLE